MPFKSDKQRKKVFAAMAVRAQRNLARELKRTKSVGMQRVAIDALTGKVVVGGPSHDGMVNDIPHPRKGIKRVLATYGSWKAGLGLDGGDPAGDVYTYVSNPKSRRHFDDYLSESSTAKDRDLIRRLHAYIAAQRRKKR